jgi:hypothetical protein
MGSAPTKTHIPNRNGTKKGSTVYQARIFKRSWDSNINPARTGTSSTPRKAQNITPASLPVQFKNIREILLYWLLWTMRLVLNAS